jgi:hypothetical protein
LLLFSLSGSINVYDTGGKAHRYDNRRTPGIDWALTIRNAIRSSECQILHSNTIPKLRASFGSKVCRQGRRKDESFGIRLDNATQSSLK